VVSVSLSSDSFAGTVVQEPKPFIAPDGMR
jgi:hypothetical protein